MSKRGGTLAAAELAAAQAAAAQDAAEQEAVDENAAATVPEPPPQDPARGSIGWVCKDVFSDLYAPPAETAPDANGAAGGESAEEQARELPPVAAAQEAHSRSRASSATGEEVASSLPAPAVDLRAEDAEIAALQANLEQEQSRLDDVLGTLREKQAMATEKDREEAGELQTRWGLTMREQFPVPDSRLAPLLGADELEQNGLLNPCSAMLSSQRQQQIAQGLVTQHENNLAGMDPGEPHHLQTTRALKLRKQIRGIQPTLTDKHHTILAGHLEQKRHLRPQPSAYGLLNAEEREKNREILKEMERKVNFLKNPRYRADRTAAAALGEPCPFQFNPATVVFRGYEVGGVYEVDVELRNITSLGRRLRVLPPQTPCFSIGALRYDGSKPADAAAGATVAPGLAARLAVRFQPEHLNDAQDELTVATEVGNFTLQVLASRRQPKLDFATPVDCGSVLAGTPAFASCKLVNRGGEGAFRLIAAAEAEASAEGQGVQYETEGEIVHLVSSSFRVTPASFYLEAGQKIDLAIHFKTATVGSHCCALLIEGDNGESMPLTLEGFTDAICLELSRWPSMSGEVPAQKPQDSISPWSFVPWQLNWLGPGVQVGSDQAQSITITNGGLLPVKVEWRISEPPRTLLSRLAVGAQQRLTDEILGELHAWPTWNHAVQAKPECPFTVEPSCATIAPSSPSNFTVRYHAHLPLGHRSTAFACLYAVGVPMSGHCLLPYVRLLELQDARPKAEGVRRGLPLFGGAVSLLQHMDDNVSTPEKAVLGDVGTCAVTAICLQGSSIGPSVTCLPSAVALAGDVLPFIVHTRELTLRNSGLAPACFRVRLTSKSETSPMSSALWIVGSHEVGPRPHLPELGPEASDVQLAAELLAAQWPPLPPGGPNAAGPGAGAAVTVAVEPHEGEIPAGGEVVLQLSIRAVREGDVSAQLMVELPLGLDVGAAAAAVAPPLAVGVRLAVRAPRVQLGRTGHIDFGAVRAHAQHRKPLHVSNPTRLPLLLRLRQCSASGGAPTDDQLVSDAQHCAAFGGSSSSTAFALPPFEPPLAVPRLSVRGCAAQFPMASHAEVVKLFVDAVRGGETTGFTAVPGEDLQEPVVEPWAHARSNCLDMSGRARPGAAALEARTATESTSSRCVGDDEDFIFMPSCLVLWPEQTAEVEVKLRTREVAKYKALIEAVGFDSLSASCVNIAADVQLPKVRLSSQRCHFAETYVGTKSELVEIELYNDSHLPATFGWPRPSAAGPSTCLEVFVEPSEGTLPPRGSVKLTAHVVPIRLPLPPPANRLSSSTVQRGVIGCSGAIAELCQQLTVAGLLQPTLLRVSARVFGPELDYAVVPLGEVFPKITHQARALDSQVGQTYPVARGRAAQDFPKVDFGEMELLKSKSLQVVLYNRSGIPTPFTAHMGRFPIFNTNMPGCTKGTAAPALEGPLSPLATAARPNAGSTGPMEVFSFANEPRAAPSRGLDEDLDITNLKGGNGGSPKSLLNTSKGAGSQRARTGRHEPKLRRGLQGSQAKTAGGKTRRRFLLDDKHEKQPPTRAVDTGTLGAVVAQQQDHQSQNMAALGLARGWAVSVEPDQEVVKAGNISVITLTCYSDLPGLMEDELVLRCNGLHSEGEDYRIPVRLLSVGSPLYLPDQQVGLDVSAEPPTLLCGTIVPSEKSTVRRFKVGNNSFSKLNLSWRLFPKKQLQDTSEERQLLTVGLCGLTGAPSEEVAAAARGERRRDPLADDPPAKQPGSIEMDDVEVGMEELDDEEPPFKFQLWASEPPPVKDPFALLDSGEAPLRVEPEEAVVPAHGTTWFTVTLTASKPTVTSAHHYHYKLVGEGHFTHDRPQLLAAADAKAAAAQKAKCGGALPPQSTRTTQSAAVQRAEREGGAARLVRDLPNVPLEVGALSEDDSDVEAVPHPRRSPSAQVTQEEETVRIHPGFTEHTYRLVFPFEDRFAPDTPHLLTIVPSGVVENDRLLDPQKEKGLIAYAHPQSVSDEVAERPVNQNDDSVHRVLRDTPFVWQRKDGTNVLVQTWPTSLNAKFRKDFEISEGVNPDTAKFSPQAVSEFQEAMVQLFGPAAANCQVLFCHKQLVSESPAVVGTSQAVLGHLRENPELMRELAIASIDDEGLGFVADGTNGKGHKFEKHFNLTPHEQNVVYRKTGWEVMGCTKPLGQFIREAELHEPPTVAQPKGTDKTAPRPLAEDPERGLVAALVVDCVGDCILPRLVLDKNSSGEGAVSGVGSEPVFKFAHSAVLPPAQRVGGATLGTAPSAAQIPGVVSHVVRQVTFRNPTVCTISCSFRLEGPFRIREIVQAGCHPVRPHAGEGSKTQLRPATLLSKPHNDGMLSQAFAIAGSETVTLQVEFLPELAPADGWTEQQAERVLRGTLFVEYPDYSAESKADDGTDLPHRQRVRLVGTTRRPLMTVAVVPCPAYDRKLRVERAGGTELVVVEFGYVHVESSTTRRRSILLSNGSCIPARWQLAHVGRKRRAAPAMGATFAEEEDFRALDDKDVFEFGITEGELLGPSKDGVLQGTEQRQPHLWPPPPGVVRRKPLEGEEHYEPAKISISFRPSKNELYRCRFRIQVEAGPSVDFICRGCGSYDEEDDALDFEEA